MLSRISCAVVLGSILVSAAAAQTVRFDTNVGTFDLELNPTGNANLQAHVDNIISYVENGSYDLSVINRAAEGFVMQMGGFQAPSSTLPGTFNGFPSIDSTDPVIVDADNNGTVDFDVTNLLNVRGTVSLALSSSANTGNSSFFVNLGTNTSLDADSMRFVPFAVINDMSTIDLIMSLNQFDYSGGGLAGNDVPFLEGNRLVIVERAFVLSTVDESLAELALAAGATGSDMVLPQAASAGLQVLTVPEPPTLVLAFAALMVITLLKRPSNF